MRRAAILSISHDWWIDHLEPSYIFGMNVSVQELNEMCLLDPFVIPATFNCRCSLSSTIEKQTVYPRVFPIIKHGRIIERVES